MEIITPRRAGALLAICAAVMAAMFGFKAGGGGVEGVVLGVVFALGSYFALVLLEKGLEHFGVGDTQRGVMAICAWVFVIGLEILGHVGFSATARLGDIQSATMQETAYDDSRESLASAKAELAIWKERRAKLTAGAEWMATVTADGLEAQLASLMGDRLYTRSKGCTSVSKADSREHCDRIAGLREQLAAVAEVNKLDEQIAATDRLIAATADKARTLAAETHVSAAAVQGKVLASIMAGDREVTDDQIYWSNLAFSLGTAIFMVLSGIIWAVFPEERAPKPRKRPETAIREAQPSQTIINVARHPGAPLAVFGPNGVSGIVPAGVNMVHA